MATRAERLLGELESAGVERLLVSEPADLRYLTGFTGSNGLAFVGPGELVFVTDFRYVEQAAGEVDREFECVEASGDLVRAIGERLAEAGAVRIGFDGEHTTVRGLARMRDVLPDGVDLVEADGVLAGLRRVKEPGEVERIAEAARLADEALEAVLAGGIIGRTERELALALEVAMRERGAPGPSFAPIIATGPHGALPHAEPRDVAIDAGQLVVIDWGARLDGYNSDCTRTVATGDPGAEAREVYEVVRSAQEAGLAAVRGGASGRAVDGVVRGLITDAGYGEQFGHGLGHGIGLETHEGPRLSPRVDDELEAGNVVTVEPGIYLPGRFGVRIEDDAVVRDGGYEILTGLTKELWVVS